MKLKGKVEVYRGSDIRDENLLYEDDNLIVDGAGEIVVNMLTTTPSLSAIPDSRYILDTSNYTIQAISFGKDREGYKHHAHLDCMSAMDYYNVNSLNIATQQELWGGRNSASAVVFVSAHGKAAGGFASYFPSGAEGDVKHSPGYRILPKFPSPLDTKLEESSETLWATPQSQDNTNPQYFPSNFTGTEVDPITNNVSAAFEALGRIGHNPNVVEFSGGLGEFRILGGAYPVAGKKGGSAGIILTELGQLRDKGYVGDNPLGTSIFTSAIFYGKFNEASSMDSSGYLGQVYSMAGNVAPSSELYGGTRLPINNIPSIHLSGMIVSAHPTFSSTGEVIYQTYIPSGDLGFTNFYGGIFNMGLWALDIRESLKTGVTPPYVWHPTQHYRKYKLFAKKSFTTNLAEIQDHSDEDPGMQHYKDLTLIWRVYF